MRMKTPKIEKLNQPEILHEAASLPMCGKLAVSSNNLVYLDINDEFIHRLFPLLKDKQVMKPAYFAKGSAGAHITVIYPEENTRMNKKDLDSPHSFVIKDLANAEIGMKTYSVILVESDSLLQLRKKYHLPDLLCFKGYSIGFHITIGVKNILDK